MTKKLKSIEDIARLAGVSKSTVSRALNGSTLVGADTMSRILAIAKEHDFQPSYAARNLSLSTSRTVGFVMDTDPKHGCAGQDLFSLEILGGISVGLHELGYDLLVLQVEPNAIDWASSYLDSGRVDGFIIMASVWKRRRLDALLAMGAPFVAWEPGRAGYCSVCGDDRKGGRLAVERLASIGRQRIAFLGGYRGELEVSLRLEGYAEAMESAGLDPKALVAYGDCSERGAAREVKKLLEKDPELDGIFANNDVMAIAAMRKLGELGKRVPQDVAVIGYDGLSMAAYTAPPLTTISQRIPEAGRMLARDLVVFLENGVITNTVMPVELIVRDSA
jgi:DNA-binding LacI/PurR family transcriptional regulator